MHAPRRGTAGTCGVAAGTGMSTRLMFSGLDGRAGGRDCLLRCPTLPFSHYLVRCRSVNGPEARGMRHRQWRRQLPS